jgi:diacylglycerol kinase (ATP)
MVHKVKYIHFIINPISGKGNNSITEKEIRKYFPKQYFQVKIEYTQYPKHAIGLTRIALSNKPNIIVACGGDGTINEVASCLVGKSIKLGIIPIGSGNGLASNLKISKSVSEALRLVSEGKSVSIDVGKVNEHYFFCNSGLGIEALVIKKYKENGRRNFLGYLRATFSATSAFKYKNFNVEIDDNFIEVEPFMFSVSNSNEPKSNTLINDGYLNLMFVPKINFFNKLILGTKILFNKADNFQHSISQKVKKIHLNHDYLEVNFQIDGEFTTLKKKNIHISIEPHALEVIVP